MRLSLSNSLRTSFLLSNMVIMTRFSSKSHRPVTMTMKWRDCSNNTRIKIFSRRSNQSRGSRGNCRKKPRRERIRRTSEEAQRSEIWVSPRRSQKIRNWGQIQTKWRRLNDLLDRESRRGNTNRPLTKRVLKARLSTSILTSPTVR